MGMAIHNFEKQNIFLNQFQYAEEREDFPDSIKEDSPFKKMKTILKGNSCI